MRAALPNRIDNHDLLRLIGSGAYGEVFLARNTVTGSYRAIKFVWRKSFKDDRPYQRELAAIRHFEPISRSHPGFVQVLQVGEVEGAFYYIMELADDERLGQNIEPNEYSPHSLARKTADALPPAECISIGIHLATALAVLHRSGLIHRDIKPSNIIFVNGMPKLADVGLVAQIAEANSFVGTAGFVPPEGPVSPASDVFSLGKVLYEMSTGKDRCEFPELPSDVSSDQTLYLELNQIVLKACNPRPDLRYSSAEAMREELELLEAGTSIKRLRDLQKRFKVAAVISVSMLLVAIAGFLVKGWLDREAAAVERRVAYTVARGTDYMKAGDLASALPFFIAAAADDPRNELTHRLRVGALVALGIPRVSVWTGAPTGKFSPDGKWIVLVGTNCVEVRNAATGALAERVPTESQVRRALLNRDNSLLGYSLGPTFLIHDQTRGTTQKFEFSGDIESIAFHPTKGETALCLTNLTQFLNLADGTRETLPTSDNRAWGEIVYSPDGGRFAFMQLGGTVQVWQRNPLTPLSPKFQHLACFWTLFDPKHTDRVLTCGFERSVFWDVRTGEILTKPLDHEYGAYSAVISPDGNVLASGGLDRTVRLAAPSSLLARSLNPVLYHPDRVVSVAFYDNDTVVAHCSDGSNHVWNIATNKLPILRIPWEPLPRADSASNAVIQLNAAGNVLEIRRNGRIERIQFQSQISAAAIHPHLTLLAVGTEDLGFDHHAARVYRTDNLETPAYELRHMDGINYIGFSPSGRLIVTCSEDHTASLWDAETGKQMISPMKHNWQVRWADFSPDETWLATAGWDSTIRIWDVRTGEPICPPLVFPDFLEYVKFEDGGRAIVAANTLRSLRFRLELPLASLPIAQYKDALPAPGSLVVNPAGF